MKRILFLLVISILLVILYGCKVQTDSLKIKDYFPIQSNVKYIYQGSGNQYASFCVYNEYTSDNKIQQRTVNGGSEIIKVIENKDGKLTKKYSLGETYYMNSFLESKGVEEVLLMEPLKAGTSWVLSDKSTRTITNIDNEKTIEVTTENKNGKTLDYYAKNKGLIKTVFKTGNTEITSELSKIEENTPFVRKVKFYYPDLQNSKLYYKNKDVSFNTNDNPKDVLGKAYKELISSSIGKFISDKVVINKLSLGKDKMVYIDFNSAFKDEMNAGAQYETMTLQSIVNTFGNYYQTDKVILTVDDKPYESGHIKMNSGQAFTVKLENITEK